MQRTRRSRRRALGNVAVWAAAALSAGVTATQLTGWNRSRWVAITQSLTPAIALLSIPVAVIGARQRNLVLTATGLTAAGVLGAIVGPAVSTPCAPAVVRPNAGLSIAHSNMLYLNVDLAGDLAATLLGLDADVLAMSEITEHHRRALIAAGAFESYPHRIGEVARRSEGIVLWSRYPLSDVTIRAVDSRPGIVATVAAPDGEIRIVLAHPDPPTMGRGLRRWSSSLEMIGSLGASCGPPTVIVADLNASRWHPVFRRLLSRGWRDAHESCGQGLAPSWPTDRRLVPPFIRLDHALVGSGLDVVGVVDFEAPGSDHRGFVVTVAVTPATPATRASSR